MQNKNKKILRLFFIIVHITIILLYLLVCLVPFLDPGKFWFIAILGMIYPFLLIAVVLCFIISLLLKSKWLILPLAALLISWQQFSVVFALHTKKEFNIDKPENILRVLSWNVSSWTENLHSMGKNFDNGLRSLMMDEIQMQNADVLCFQEYFESFAPELYPQNIPLFKKMGFNYYFFSPSAGMVNNSIQTGLIIFSKYPIIDTAYYKSNHKSNTEGFSFIDIQFQKQTIRIVNTHLESPRIAKQEYAPLTEVEESKTIIGKIKRTYSLRKQQSKTLRKQLDDSPYPVILCGDFNDVPNSYSYFKVKGNLQDAFLKKGSGIGRTFRFISPNLRIDYIMADKKFNIQQFEIIKVPYSDHYPLVTDLDISKK